MENLKIGRLVFKKKAILLMAFCLFLNGMTIGALVANHQVSDKKLNFIIFYVAIFIPYLLLFKSIKKNIIELEN